jgi:hypothetical protein
MDLRERAESSRRHPWELARARYFRRRLAEHVDLATVGRVLDIGAGDSWFAEGLRAELDPATAIVCWDVNYDEDELADAPPGIMRTAVAPTGTFLVVTALDVLEHVGDEHGFLTGQILPALGPRAVVVISVPAHPRLYSDHDRFLGHHRRYRPAELRTLVGRYLDVVDQGSLFTSLLAPRLAEVALERLGRHRGDRGVGHWDGGPRLTGAVEATLDADAAAGRWLSQRGLEIPGLSTWVVARAR